MGLPSFPLSLSYHILRWQVNGFFQHFYFIIHWLSDYSDVSFNYYRKIFFFTQTCCSHLTGGIRTGVNAGVGCEGSSITGSGRGLRDAGAHWRLAVANVDVVNVRVCLQCEDEADQVGGGEQHRNCIHQWPRKDTSKKLESLFRCWAKSLRKLNLLNLGENQMWVSLTLTE